MDKLTPPQAIEVERGIIGAMLMERHCVPVILSQLSRQDFTDRHTRLFFEACRDVYNDNATVDLVSVEQSLRAAGKWDPQNRSDLTGMLDFTISTTDADYYCEILKQYTLRRKLIADLSAFTPKPYDTTIPVGELMGDLERIQSGTLETAPIGGRTPDEIDRDEANKPQYERMNLGIRFFDETFYKDGGSHRGTTELIYAWTKHGKTSMALFKTACYIASGYRGMYITMEDKARKINQSIKSQLGTGHPNRNNLIIADTSECQNLDDIISVIRYHNAKEELDFCVVDYLGIIPVTGIDYQNETPRIKTASNTLTRLMNQLDIFGMFLAQVHKVSDNRRGWSREPEISDLYGSSALEQDCFLATMVFRPKEVKDLCLFDHEGEVLKVTAPDDSQVDKNSVYIRQKLIRDGEKYTSYFRFIHTEKGLEMASVAERRNTQPQPSYYEQEAF